ncbi:MAG: aminotransferase class III-fold pyridoxal phosphate-dependent enzyme [SAR202 cluster bacterium]|nr:aminotransferase class III-fold pyridoxal phosphate-dependent enzyme [SAR202 cluster bacterium]|tara:strand:- start:2995 stop:4317 length:1323 start_codon:yes stop_codon:yes gene_type:complete
MGSIIDTYTEKFRKSSELYDQGHSIVPGGGHQSRVQKPFPYFVNTAKGSRKIDVDGNKIIDYMMGFGSLILGHSHPVVVEKIYRQIQNGTHLGALSELELIWGRKVKDLIPSAERVRFTSSGTEATLLAMRLARGYTGKKKIIKFVEHYHGWHDYAIPQSGLNTEFGIPKDTLSSTVVLEPKINLIEDYLEKNDDVAGIIFEATGGHWGQFPLQNPTFVMDLRKLTVKHDVVMIMDEVICGFRMSKGGAQKRFGVIPDLTTMAKIVAGGLPGGAVAGNQKIMSLLSEKNGVQKMFHPGTFNANPVSATAGIATLELIAKEQINHKADLAAQKLKLGLREVLHKREVQGHVHGVSSIVHLVLGVEGKESDEGVSDVSHSELARATMGNIPKMLKLAFLNEGIDIMGGMGFFVSAVHSEDDINETVEKFEKVINALRSDGVI